ncbi:MAG: tRNA (adenosine(37)-N6)-threonylcarbamoyltransferase complex ATPase subunit type 1 TsaE [Candidatus Paceibacterota bacterium]|jgi:tRNA threonylcarbamoyladenosine biosynthesis protein TsaE
MEKVVHNLAELEEEAKRFVSALTPSATGATLVTLSGELGAGKTAFTKTVAWALGVAERVTSPTFVLEKVYLLSPELGHRMSKFKKLVHIDAYRLESGSELAALGFDELMQDAGNLVLLEWPEKVADALPEPSVRIAFVAETDGSRTIIYG